MSEEKPPFYSVSIHLIDRAFGGPEEGGWWFDYGEPDHEFWNHVRLFGSYEEARDYGKSLTDMVKELNKGRPDIGSVLSQGRYDWVIQDGYPHAWPEKRPHYE